MPFWWRRRRKNWYGRFRYRRRFQRPKRRARRRRFTRRRGRYTAGRRRRRRRRYKVRRKRQKITIKQWQPESIVKCKAKGLGCLVLGAEGRQFYCWTNEAATYVQPKAPGGGGFGCEVITLEYLYKEYKAHNCIFTKTNHYKDLVRYTGCEITLYRHPYIDFMFAYSIQPPFNINQFTYPDIHPQNMLLRRHKKVILSRASKPNGPLKVKIRIRPPKQLSTRWFFQKEFSEVPLVLLQASACDFDYPRIGCCNVSQLMTIFYLNPEFWGQGDWAQYRDHAYMNIATGVPLIGTYKNKQGQPATITVGDYTSSPTPYYASINYDLGWFDTRFLNSYKIQKKGSQQEYGHLPLAAARYNPNEDTGEGNEVWLTSVVAGHFNKPTKTPDFLIVGLPLWMAFYGFWNYLQYTTKAKDLFTTHMFVVRSPAIKKLSTTVTQDYYPFVDQDFMNGKLPYDEYLSANEKTKWYPTAEKQVVTINSFVECGPYIPRLNNQKASTWELNYKYKFFFKWGGPQTTDPPIDDPKLQPTYDVPSVLQKTVQIKNPKKQSAETILHEWDFRRGFVTQRALKRMSENFETDTDVQSDDSEPEKKKRKVSKALPNHQEQEEKIQSYLHSLYESDSSQEETEDLQKYIQQQHKQQHKLKRNILKLLTHLKQRQRCLQLQAGFLE
nr:MAG: ORF1 [Torque teno midi virus]